MTALELHWRPEHGSAIDVEPFDGGRGRCWSCYDTRRRRYLAVWNFARQDGRYRQPITSGLLCDRCAANQVRIWSDLEEVTPAAVVGVLVRTPHNSELPPR